MQIRQKEKLTNTGLTIDFITATSDFVSTNRDLVTTQVSIETLTPTVIYYVHK